MSPNMSISKIVIIGDGPFAEIAYEYFTNDSEYSVVGFSVEKEFLTRTEFHNLPVYPFEDLEKFENNQETGFFVAIPYNQLNRLRTRLYLSLKSRGYQPLSYVSSRAFVWQNVILGEHVFIFENNVVQPFVEIGSNTVLWSGNHIGHHSKIHSNCFISSHVVLSGFTEIGNGSFLGVNSTISNNVSIGSDNFVGIGAVITKNTSTGIVTKGEASKSASLDSYTYFKIDHHELG